MKRLEAIASLVTKNAKVIDIGTDHAYLPVILYKNNITKNITASDISSKVLEYSKKTLEKKNLQEIIKLVKSDGFKDIEETFDEAIISGMGTHLIINILSCENIPDSLIISSHKNIELLRIFMQKKGYKIIQEITIKEKGKYYNIIKYQKGFEVLTDEEILFGKSKDREYINYLKEKYQKLYIKTKQEKYLKIIEKMSNWK